MHYIKIDTTPEFYGIFFAVFLFCCSLVGVGAFCCLRTASENFLFFCVSVCVFSRLFLLPSSRRRSWRSLLCFKSIGDDLLLYCCVFRRAITIYMLFERGLVCCCFSFLSFSCSRNNGRHQSLLSHSLRPGLVRCMFPIFEPGRWMLLQLLRLLL